VDLHQQFFLMLASVEAAFSIECGLPPQVMCQVYDTIGEADARHL
jgi:hypothetical protein